ncbi:MAG: YybH family protein [Thermoanaerobaculia bacterium]
MRKPRMGVAFLACLLAGGLAASALGADHGAAEVDQRWSAAMKANDTEAVMACYAPDAVMWLPDAPEARGEKAIREAYQGLLSANTVQAVAFTNTHYETSRGLSTGWGDFAVTLQPKSGGEPTVLRGRFTAVAQRRGGRWVYVADHASSGPSKP